VILDTLALDPDPEVRAAAAQRLASTRSFEAITGLLDAIYDPVPEVALEAIDALTAIKDRSVILSMKSALDHRLEPTVQQALQRGIQSLEFSARMASDEIEIDREASLENSDQVIPQN
jgi:HEAT repeat protein